MADAIRDGDVLDTMEELMTERIDLCLADQKAKIIKRIKDLESKYALAEVMFARPDGSIYNKSLEKAKRDVIQFVMQAVEKDV